MRFLKDWAVAAGAAFALLLVSQWVRNTHAPELGSAPDFTLADLDGSHITLSEIDADVVVLNFWFTSCPPCRVEIPELSAFQHDNPEIPIVGVSTDVGMPIRTLSTLSKRLGIDYLVAHDVRGQTSTDFGVSRFPTTLVLRDMNVVSTHVGIIDQRRLEAMIAASEG